MSVINEISQRVCSWRRENQGGLGGGHGTSGFVRIVGPGPRPGRCSVLAGGLATAHRGRLAAQLLSCQECRRSRRFIFILASTVMCPASPALGQPWSGIQPGSVFYFGSAVADWKPVKWWERVTVNSCSVPAILPRPKWAFRKPQSDEGWLPAGMMHGPGNNSVLGARGMCSSGRPRPHRAGSLL